MSYFGKLLLLAATALWATTGTLTTEKLLPVAQERNAFKPATGYGNNVFLVVWQSGRFETGDITKGLNPIGDLVACRVKGDGQILDALPLNVSTAKDLQEAPQVAFGNGVFLVVWQDLRNGKDYDIYATRITPEGTVLDTQGILVAGGLHNQAQPRVTWDGRTFWVVWSDFRSKPAPESQAWYEVYGGRVSTDGTRLDSNGVAVFSNHVNWPFFHCYYPATASLGNGKSFSVCITKMTTETGEFWKVAKGLGRFISDGLASPDTIWCASTSQPGFAQNAYPVALAASSQKNYLAVWGTDFTAGRGGSDKSANAMLFDSTAAKRTTFLLSSAVAISNPSVCWDDSLGYVAAWHQVGADTKNVHDVLCATQVTAAGVSLATPFDVSGNLASPACNACVAATGDGTAIVAYEKHPIASTDKIRVGFRFLTTAIMTETQDITTEELSGAIHFSANTPFQSALDLKFFTKSKRKITLSVYDVNGRKIANLFDGVATSGTHAFSWSGVNKKGISFATGFYIVKLQTSDGISLSRRVMKTK